MKNRVFAQTLSGPGSGTFQAIVLGTDASGRPILPILWQSGIIPLPSVRTEYTFTPNIPLSVGNLFFIGADFGSLTTATGSSDSLLGLADAHPAIPDGMFWETLNSNSPPEYPISPI